MFDRPRDKAEDGGPSGADLELPGCENQDVQDCNVLRQMPTVIVRDRKWKAGRADSSSQGFDGALELWLCD